MQRRYEYEDYYVFLSVVCNFMESSDVVIEQYERNVHTNDLKYGIAGQHHREDKFA
jgi:hypothetical protein